MKTSNKLLLGLVALLYLVPLATIVGDLKNYKPLDAKGKKKTEVRLTDSLSGYITTPFGNKLTSMEVLNGTNLHFVVEHHLNANSGIKISEEARKLMTVELDKNGKLSVRMRGLPADRYVYIHVYSPALNTLSIQKAAGLTLEAKLDSLNLEVTDLGTLLLNRDVQVHQLKLSADGVKNLELNQTKLHNANINLSNSRLEMLGLSIASLNLRASGSEITQADHAEIKTPTRIAKFDLVAEGNNRLDFAKVGLGKVSGRLSDGTVINMPVRHLRALLND